MKTKIETKWKVLLELNAEEALYLKRLVQNYIGDSLVNEPSSDQRIRIGFWDNLPSMLELENKVSGK